MRIPAHRIAVAVLGLALAASVHAQPVIHISTDITTSTTWTANNVYDLQTQIYVTNNSTLTIQAGTVIASSALGSIAVTRGSQIFVQGTAENPVIMTSAADRATWTGGNPRTGTWRASANEWGNLTIMGNGYISENVPAGQNTPAPNASNFAVMEGLVEGFSGDPRVRYGGGNDNDDSGTISYLSIRYGGKVIGQNNELNGLSLGGVGRNTDIHHVEIMNNVDDGVEIWGGTVNLKNLSIWNVGDDSFDVDQGWRGKAQFILIVQGYSLNAAQGSGVGDNAFEVDGAEQSDYQPVTTAAIYNATVIGQPGTNGGDHGMAFRDNARIQYRNCVFMDLGERLVSFDNVDGDGGQGYGFNGTLSWANTWTTPYTATSTVNAPASPAAFYQAQASGNLIEVRDTVAYNNTHSSAYTEANARGVFGAGTNNLIATSSPIASITRAPTVLPPLNGTLLIAPVIGLDPRPANDALTSVAWAPADGYFNGAHYRGAFAPGVSWLRGWTASDAFGLTGGDPVTDLGGGVAGISGDPVLAVTGPLTAGNPFTVSLSNAAPNTVAILAVGAVRLDLPIANGFVVPDFTTAPGFYLQLFTDGSGSLAFGGAWPALPSGTRLYAQYGIVDAAATASGGLALSNAVMLTSN